MKLIPPPSPKLKLNSVPNVEIVKDIKTSLKSIRHQTRLTMYRRPGAPTSFEYIQHMKTYKDTKRNKQKINPIVLERKETKIEENNRNETGLPPNKHLS